MSLYGAPCIVAESLREVCSYQIQVRFFGGLSVAQETCQGSVLANLKPEPQGSHKVQGLGFRGLGFRGLGYQGLSNRKKAP